MALVSKEKYTVYQLNPKEFHELAFEYKKSQLQSDEKVAAWFSEMVLNAFGASDERVDKLRAHLKEHGQTYKDVIGWWPWISDAKLLTVLAKDMRAGGNLFGKYTIATEPSGRVLVRLTGDARLRTHLNAVIYFANDRRLITMGVGRLGARDAIKGGFIISMYISAGYRLTKYTVDNTQSWRELVAGLATDLAFAAGSAIIVDTFSGAFLSLAGGVASVTIAPMGAVVAVCLVVGITAVFFPELSAKLEEKIATALEELESSIRENIVDKITDILRDKLGPLVSGAPDQVMRILSGGRPGNIIPSSP